MENTTVYCNTGIFGVISSDRNKISKIQGSRIVVPTISGNSLSADSIAALNLNISNAILRAISANSMSIPGDIAGTTINVNQINISGALNTPSLTVNTVFSDSITASGFKSDTISTNSLTCNRLFTKKLTVSDMAISGSYFTSGVVNITGILGSLNMSSIPQNLPVIINKQTIKGTIDNPSEYNLISNTNTLLSDMLIVQSDGGQSTFLPRLFINGEVQNGGDSLPRMVSFNYQLSPSGIFDLGTGYGGQTAYLSLGITTGSSSRTLRYQKNGKLSIYSDPNTILWESSNQVSDFRAKEYVATVTGALNTLQNLKPVYYKFKDKSISEEEQIGFIAQDVEPYIPECVTKRENQNYLIHMERLVSFLIEGINEL